MHELAVFLLASATAGLILTATVAIYQYLEDRAAKRPTAVEINDRLAEVARHL